MINVKKKLYIRLSHFQFVVCHTSFSHMDYFYDYFIVLFVIFGSSQALGSLLLLNGKDQCELGLSSDYNLKSN